MPVARAQLIFLKDDYVNQMKSDDPWLMCSDEGTGSLPGRILALLSGFLRKLQNFILKGKD